MPILKSAIKANRQSKTRTQRNNAFKSKHKDILKGFLNLVKEGKKKEASESLSKLYKSLDLLGKKNIFHHNKSDRNKSRFAKMFAKAFPSK